MLCSSSAIGFFQREDRHILAEISATTAKRLAGHYTVLADVCLPFEQIDFLAPGLTAYMA
jgi:hypothetical protein